MALLGELSNIGGVVGLLFASAGSGTGSAANRRFIRLLEVVQMSKSMENNK